MDIIDFEKNRGTVEIGSNAERLKPYIEQSEEPAWDRLYAGVTVGATTLFGLSLLGVPSAALTLTAVLVAFLAVMLACITRKTYVNKMRELTTYSLVDFERRSHGPSSGMFLEFQFGERPETILETLREDSRIDMVSHNEVRSVVKAQIRNQT